MASRIGKEIGDEIRQEIRKENRKDLEKDKLKNPHLDEASWWEERRLGMKIFLGFLIGVGVVALAFLLGWVVMLLWNWLIPDIFGLNAITYWQAWGLFLLTSILFKSMPGDKSDGGKLGDRRRKRELRNLMEEEPESGDATDSVSSDDMIDDSDSGESKE